MAIFFLVVSVIEKRANDNYTLWLRCMAFGTCSKVLPFI